MVALEPEGGQLEQAGEFTAYDLEGGHPAEVFTHRPSPKEKGRQNTEGDYNIVDPDIIPVPQGDKALGMKERVKGDTPRLDYEDDDSREPDNPDSPLY